MYWRRVSLLAITAAFSPNPQTSLLFRYITIRSQLSLGQICDKKDKNKMRKIKKIICTFSPNLQTSLLLQYITIRSQLSKR